MGEAVAVERLEELRGIVAEVLERDPNEIADRADFVEEYQADSLRAIEILARLEKRYKVDIPQAALPKLRNLVAVYEEVAQRAGWPAYESRVA